MWDVGLDLRTRASTARGRGIPLAFTATSLGQTLMPLHTGVKTTLSASISTMEYLFIWYYNSTSNNTDGGDTSRDLKDLVRNMDSRCRTHICGNASERVKEPGVQNK